MDLVVFVWFVFFCGDCIDFEGIVVFRVGLVEWCEIILFVMFFL